MREMIGQRNDANKVLDFCPGSDSVSGVPLTCDCSRVNPKSKGSGVSETNRLFSFLSILEVIFPEGGTSEGNVK